MVSKLPPYLPSSVGFGADDAAFLSRNGFNAVRLGVIYAGVEPQPGVYDDAYLSRIASTVRALGRQGIYSLLEFHQDQYNERFHGEGFPAWSVQDDGLPNTPDLGFPGNYLGMPAVQHAFDHLWADSPGPGGVGLQERYAAAWAHVASRFAGNRNVLGYDLINEPWPGTTWAQCISGCPAFDAQLGAMQKKAIDAIRTADRRHLIWYEPNPLYNQGLLPTQLPRLSDPRLGFSFHAYCLGGPADVCAKGERGALSNARARAAATGDAILLTEFGATPDTATLSRIAGEADDQMVPWLEWAYCGCGDPTTSASPPSSQAVIVDPARPPRGSNVVGPSLDALSRPYPQAVAGTPKSFSFNPDSGTFSLRYSPKKAGGHGSFKPGSCTAVFVPARHYRHGYKVKATGARVISKRGNGLLALALKRGATAVRVRVTPARRGHTGPPKVTKSCA